MMSVRDVIKGRLTKAMYSLSREILSTDDLGSGEIIVHIVWDEDEIVAFEEGEKRPPKAVKPEVVADEMPTVTPNAEYMAYDKPVIGNQYPKEFDDQPIDFRIGDDKDE